MLMNQIARKNWMTERCGLRRGFLLGALAAVVFAVPSSFYVQTPLTVQPSTGRPAANGYPCRRRRNAVL